MISGYPYERNASMYFAPNEHKDGQIWSWIQTLDTGYGYIGSQAYLDSSKKVLGSQSMNNFIWSLVCIYRGNWLLEINCDTFMTIRQPPLFFFQFTLDISHTIRAHAQEF